MGLQLVIVHRGEVVVGVAPLYAGPGRELRPLGASALFDLEPLAAAENQGETLALMAHAIAAMRPASVSFIDVAVPSPWPAALASGWGRRRPWVRRGPNVPCVAIRVEGSFDTWFHERGKAWRGEFRRRERRFREQGGEVGHPCTPEEVHHALDALARLHHARWGAQNHRMDDVMIRTLRDAADGLLSSGGLSLWTAEHRGEIVAAAVFARAGTAVALTHVTYDAQWRRFAPGLHSVVSGIEEAFRTDAEIVDFGYGEHAYKFSLGTEVRTTATLDVFPPGVGYPVKRLRELPRRAGARARRVIRTQLASGRSSGKQIKR